MNADLAYDLLTAVLFLVLSGVAAFVFTAAPRRLPNQLLALYLVLLGFAGLGQLEDVLSDARLSYNLEAWTTALLPATITAYLAFVGSAVPTPLARPIGTRAFRVGVLVLSAVWFVATFAFPAVLVSQGPPVKQADGGTVWPEAWPVYLTVPLVWLSFAYGAVCALSALRRSPRGTIAGNRARAYAIAFVTIDAGLVTTGVPLVLHKVVPYAAPLQYALRYLQILAIAIGVLLVVRGMLRYQLFDFDLKVKWTLKRGTLVAVILGAFFIVTALAEQYLQQLGWVFGGLAVGALLFALRPIERAIDRMADRAMPRTTGTPEYLAARKHEIYRAALEEATRDGAVSTKERRLLLRLSADLGLSAEDAIRIEQHVIEAEAAA